MPTYAPLEWDNQGTKKYEAGVSKGVLYKYDSTSQKWKGVAWNGLISVTESPDGAEETELWADNIKYGSLRSAEKFGGSIEAYTYPPEFESCDGMVSPAAGTTIGQQSREVFRLCYRTEISNDTNANAGYKLHLVYGATCTPSEKSYETINDSPDAITFSWDFDTTPVNVTGHKATSIITIDSTTCTAANLTTLEGMLYGSSSNDAYMPDPDTVISTMSAT